MSKDLEILKADVKKLMLKDWTKTEVEKLSEFMEDVIIATMVVNKLPIHVAVKSFYCQTERYDKSKNKQCDECGLVELNNMQ